MGKHKHTDADIAKQPYKGPSATVAGVGEGALQAKVLTFGGLIVGGIAAALFPKQTSKVVEKIQGGVTKASQSENGLMKIVGDFGKFTLDIGKHTAEIFTKSKMVENRLGTATRKAKIERIVDGAIITSAAGSILGIFTGGSHGVQSARAGKRQVHELQEEVQHLRKTVLDKETQIEDMKTASAAKSGALKVAGDTQHDMADEAPAKANWADTVAEQKAAAKDAQVSL